MSWGVIPQLAIPPAHRLGEVDALGLAKEGGVRGETAGVAEIRQTSASDGQARFAAPRLLSVADIAKRKIEPTEFLKKLAPRAQCVDLAVAGLEWSINHMVISSQAFPASSIA